MCPTYDWPVLDQIVAGTRRRLTELSGRADEIYLAAARRRPRPFGAALTGSGLAVIAEVKRRSPSRGSLAPHLDPVAQAQAYAAGGAAGVSVLTEPDYFEGSPEDLEGVAAAVGIPVLRKDFVVDPLQIWEARALGADAVLLIVAALDDADLSRLLAETAAAEMDALVEVHDEREVVRALGVGAGMIGVNNRNLADFSVDLGVAERLAGELAGVEVTVAESGIMDASDAARMAAAGYDAVLVGEALVRAPDPAELVRALGATGQG